MILDHRHCYQALKARDARFDGVFFVAVSTTKIYCRPICTAKLPQPDRCTFYPHAALAEQAGYRPCLRCRPELAPGYAVVDAQRTAAHWAMARIREGALDHVSWDTLAAEYGLSARQLRRSVEHEYGVPPIELAQTQRLLAAKQLLTDTTLSMSAVADASGFGSVRRFNHLFRTTYGLNPLKLRQQQAPHRSEDAVTLKLAYRPPLHWTHLAGFLASRGAVGVETRTGDHYRRTVRIGTHRGWIGVAPIAERHQLALQISAELVPVMTPLLAKVRRLLDLDANPQVIEAHLTQSPFLRQIVSRASGLRVPGTMEGFDLAVRAILGQQVSVKAASTLFKRYTDAFGEAVATPYPELNRLSPTPARVAEAKLQQIIDLGMPAKRAESVHRLAKAVVDDRISLESPADPDATRAALLALPGIGDWTVSYIAMRALRDTDAFPQGDLGLIKAMRLQKPKELLNVAEAWRPWRAYAALHLWNSLNAGG